MRINAKQIVTYTGGSMIVEPIDASLLCCGISWDSREVAADDVYVALPGERVDGHAFVGDALRGGAHVVLVSEKLPQDTLLLAREMGAAVIEVSNTASAITDIARMWRMKLQGKVIGVTGSSGKTTTKNLVRDVLSSSFSVVATAGNQNNELGVPKTILAADPETQVIVVEMGMRGLGQISELCDFVRPDMGLVTNVGEGHIELLGTRENIARAKAELLTALPDRIGTAFLNSSDDFSAFMAAEAQLDSRGIETVYFSGGEVPDASLAGSCAERGAWASDIGIDEQGYPCFVLHVGADSLPCTVPFMGIHNVHNACAAASVGAAMGMDIKTMVSALATALPECGRQETLQARAGFSIINDSYNANPDSMRASLVAFNDLPVRGRHVAVLGDMGELGDFGEPSHKGVGALVAALDIDLLICIGELSKHTAESAVSSGMTPERVMHVSTISEIIGELDTYLSEGDAVLVKASRFMGLERVVGGLVN